MFGGGNFPSVMKHNFSMVPKAEIPRSQFDRSHGYKTTFNSGYLVPVFVDEALPGDTFSLRANMFGRLSTPIAPVMDNLYLDSFFFAVPVRLLWSNFKKMMGEQDNPGDSTSYLVPIMTSPTGGYTVGSLQDYLGLPTAGTNGVDSTKTFSHSALWTRAYNRIWNEWFRDENLQNSVTVDTGDGPDTYTNYTLLRRGKRHDYFTSALPWPQKGTAVTIPLGTSAPITRVANAPAITWYGANAQGGANAGTAVLTYNTYVAGQTTLGVTQGTSMDPNGGLIANLSSATAATINSLRQAFQLQRLYERDARGGSRYTEIVRSHFGVVSPDARLQRSEYLGGGSSPVIISPVPQTSVTASTPQGNLAGVGTVSAVGHGFTKSFTEHCVLIGLVSVRADLSYQQGLDRMWSRRSKFDFYWPALANIGEQTILNKEIYCRGDTNDDLVFGYQEAYAEYRYKNSKITGQLRSTYTTPLDIWHLSQKFTSLPTLGSTFIQETPPVSRVVAVPTAPEFIFDSYFQMKCARPMPTYSVPGLIDHF